MVTDEIAALQKQQFT